MKKQIYNCFGEPLSIDNESKVKNPEWINPITNRIDFRTTCKHGDNNGFDLLAKNKDGKYRSRIILPEGKIIARYGDPNGRYTTNPECSYDSLGLPFYRETVEYHEYVIQKDISVECIVEVDEGFAAPCFDSLGGGKQYFHFDKNIMSLIREKVLKEDFLWLAKFK